MSYRVNQRLVAVMKELRPLIVNKDNWQRCGELIEEGLSLDTIDGIWQRLQALHRKQSWSDLERLTTAFA